MLSPVDFSRALAAGFFVYALSVAAPASAQQFAQGSLQEVLDGDPVALTLTGLAPNSLVEVRGERSLDLPMPTVQRSNAQFRADAGGRVEIGSQAPLSGSYSGADASGLFWSMGPVFTYVGGGKANEFRFTAFVQGSAVAATTVVQLNRKPEVVVEQIEAFPGAVLARPPGPGRYPTLIALGGGEGGDYTARYIAPRLASEGFVVLGLPYYSPVHPGQTRAQFPQLPARFIDIPVDRLESAWAWLKTRPEVDPERIGLYGVSKGAEFSLIAATHYPWIKSVVAIVPSDVVRGGWGWRDETDGAAHSSFSFHGKPLPFTPYVGFHADMLAGARGLLFDLRGTSDAGRWAYPKKAAASRIPVERYAGALLVAGGMADGVWASGVAVQNIAEARAAAGLPTTALIFRNAGHGISSTGWQPGLAGFGGDAMENAKAQAKTWAATLGFLRRTLKPETVVR
jgi:dienelactone hydrolase